MRKSYETQARELALELGVEITGGGTEICLATPPYKYHLKSTGCHGAVLSDDYETELTIPQAWKLVLEDLKYGVEECKDSNCECLRPGTGY